ALAILYIRYSVPEFELKAKIQILEEQSSASGLDVFSDLNMFGGGGNQVQDEIEALNSRTNLIQVVKELGLNKKIIAMGKIKNSELYKNAPFNISFLAPDSTIFMAKNEFFITLKSDTAFEMALSENEPPRIQSFGKTISTAVGDVVI